jgi:ubiquinone/menaquinone biosynthesis C-methylase UbiE
MPQSEEIAHGKRFDLVAETYDQSAPPVRSEIRRRVVRLAKQLSPRQVLDMGCGSGESILELVPHVDYAVGVDVSSRMLEVAREKAAERDIRNVEFVYGSFLDARYRIVVDRELRLDCIIATYSLHHLRGPEQQSALRSICEALEPNGSLILGDLMFFGDPAVYLDDYALVGYDPAVDHPQSAAELKRIVQSQGLSASVAAIHPLAGILVARK